MAQGEEAQRQHPLLRHRVYHAYPVGRARPARSVAISGTQCCYKWHAVDHARPAAVVESYC